MLPELSIDASQLAHLKETVRSQAKQYVLRTREPPCLRYVFCGVGESPNDAAGAHDNFVVLLDVTGREIMRQRKIFRWDLSPEQVARYGLDHELGTDCRRGLKENIKAADEIVILDLPDIGRVLNLICADMDFNLPGDWLLDHFRIDWLYAPIMDKTISDLSRSNGRLETWICERAHRAALGGQSHVIVTNSMALTHKLNAANAKSTSGFPQFSQCGIALLIDATGERLKYARVDVPLSSASPVLEFRDWGKGFKVVKG